MATDGIQFTNVAKAYGKSKLAVPVFDRMNLTIDAGQFVAVMGPSGSGKSTLLHLIGGLDRTNAGEIECAGQRLDLMSDSQLTRWRGRNIGFVFQFYNLMPWLSASSNVGLPLLLEHMNRRERLRRVATALEVVELADRASHRPRALSGGQQQRVAIARALINDPAILLCDEPTGDLDRAAGENILNLLRLFNREFGKTIVMVTHDAAAANYADKTLYLDKGQFIEREVAQCC